jgi:cysteine synthase A
LLNNPQLRVVAVDAVGSVIFSQPNQPQRLQGGLGSSLIPANVDYTIIDEIHWLNDKEAFASTLELALREKIFAGNSSGSVYAVASWLSSTVQEGTNIVAIFPDRGDRYVGTIYNEAYRKEKGMADLTFPTAPREIAELVPVETWSFLKTEHKHPSVSSL